MATATSNSAQTSRRRAPVAAKIAGALPPLLSGCEGVQSALAPKGPAAALLAELWWAMLIGAAVIFVVVIALALYATLRAPAKRRPIDGNALIVAGGVALPVAVLSVLLFYTVQVSGRLQMPAADALRVEVVGHQWWWEVRYPDHPDAVTANEIHVPVGRPVIVELLSADVIHSFWVPSLAGKMDVLREQRNRLRLQADEAGVFRGLCAEFCGAQHALMGKLVIAQPPAEFDAWLARQQRPAPPPQTPVETRGREAYLKLGCLACHALRGVAPAAGAQPAPDLTHVGGRRTLAAATLRNTPANLQRWIAHNQQIKPGNLMPPFDQVDPATLEDLAVYLASLK